MTEVENDSEKSEANAAKRVSPLGVVIRIALPLFVLALGILGYGLLAEQPEEEEAPPPEPQVIRTRVADLTVQDYPVVITANGIVQPHNEITLSVQVSGQIIGMSEAFEVGSYFEEGEILVELDPRDYETALALAQAQLQSAQAALELAELNYERMQEGSPESGLGVVTRAEVEQARSELMQAEADVESSQAEVAQARLELERTKVRAPFGGRVRQKNVGLGQSVSSGTALGVVYADDYAEVRLPIPRSDMRYLTLPELEGDPTVAVALRDAIADTPETVWHGRIVRTDGALDPDSLELYAIARIDDPFGLESGEPPLRIGQPVIGSIAGDVLENVIPIPRPAVRELDQIILIDEKALTLSRHTIEPVWSDKEHVVVRSAPVFEGALLATTHLVYAPEGAEVEIMPDTGVSTKMPMDADS